MKRNGTTMKIISIAALCAAAFLCVPASALAQTVFTKAQVGDRIRKVEDGVDEFRKWTENRGEQGKTQAQAAQSSGRTRGRTATDSQKAQARDTKDDLDDALSDLNRSTNRGRIIDTIAGHAGYMPCGL